MSFDAETLMVALEHGNIPDILNAMSRHQYLGGESELAPSRGGLEPGNNPRDSHCPGMACKKMAHAGSFQVSNVPACD